MIFDSGKGYCSRCSKHFSPEEVEAASTKTTSRRQARQTFQQQYQKKLTIEDVAHFGYLGDKHRGITPDADKHFGIKTEVSGTNRKPLKRYYPYYVEDELYGYKVRTLPKDWGGAVGTIAGTDMFGWAQCTGSRRTLIIVEGEEDCAAGWSLWKAMNARSQDRRIKNGACHIISLPNGAKGCLKALMHHIEDLMKYEKIIWMGDNYHIDSEGALALEQAVQVLGVNKLYIAEYPDRKKDLCDILKLGINEGTDIFAEMYFKAKQYQPADIIDGSELTLADLEKEVTVGYPLPFPSLDDMLQGMRLYEHTIIFSGAGMGKSSMCRAIGHHMRTVHDFSIGNIYLEEKFDKTAQGYIAYDNSVALNEYRKDFSVIPIEDKEKTMKEVIRGMYFLNHNGCIAPDILMNKIRYLYNKGCKLIILDHISMVVTGSDDERKDIDSLMEQIYRFCETNPVHVLSVVHLSRDSKRDFTKGAEITANNLRGSAGLLQLCWNAVGAEGNQTHHSHGDVRFLRILKCRETGDVGICDGGYKYSKKTGRFTYDSTINKSDIEDSEPRDNKPKMGGGYDNRAS